jgi:surfactin synthase thioesterase subunit/acyl transferase domain-containing protein
LLGLVPACVGDSVVLLPSLRAGRDEPETVLEALGGWVTQQGPPNWEGVFPTGSRRVELPTYPWQRQRYWVEPTQHAQTHLGAASSGAAVSAETPGTDLWFELEWQATQLPARSAPDGRWLAVALDDPRPAQRLVVELRELGASCESVPLADVSRAGGADHVVCIWNAASDAEAAVRAATDGLLLVQALAANGFKGRLWWATHEAVAATTHDNIAPAAAAVWGLGRTVAQEQPELECTLIDLDRSGSIADKLLRELGADDGENQVAWRAEQRYAARLVRLAPAPRGVSLPAPRRPGTVLVTGGLGALGSQLARELARQGAPHLLLTSRRGAATPEAEATRASLEALGSRVTIAAVDVADRDALARVLGAVPPEFPLRVVIHAAGILDDGSLLEQTPERFEQVMAAKVAGASNLHQLTEGADLDAFILFSSLAGTLGSTGQGGYASANAFLDALAAQRRKRGLPGLSIAWGPWSERGLAAGLQAQLKRRGIGMIAPEQGVALFEMARTRAESSLVIAPLELATLAQTFGGGFVPPVWRSLIKAPGPTEAPQRGFRSQLSTLTIAERASAVASLVRAEVTRVLSLANASLVAPDKPLSELGMDSLMAVELRSAIGRRTGIHLPTALIATQPTPAVIEQYILEQVDKLSTHADEPVDTDPARNPAADRSQPNRQPSIAASSAARCEALNALEAPAARLFCLHDAGGSAAMFLPLCQLAHAGVEVHAISHTRNAPASAEAAQQYLDEAVRYIWRLADRPYVLFGHSLGGLIAWRLAQELVATGPAPSLLVVSGIDPAGPNSSMSESALDTTFAAIFGARAREAQSLKQDFSADMQLWRAMPPDTGLPSSVAVPITAFVGREDQVASEASMRDWSERTTSNFSLTVLPGNHFYLSQEPAQRLLIGALASRFHEQLSRVPILAADNNRTRSTTQFW